MLLSRFWIVLLSLALGAAAFTLYVAAQMYNHAGNRAMGEALTAHVNAVDWYLREDSRKRSAALIQLALSPDLRDGLAKASGDAKVDRDTRSKVKAALTKLASEVPGDLKFDAVWAVDANGRVIANVGYEHSEDWELGGYRAVADAIHGWITDDAWVWKGRIFRVVTRPIEAQAQGEPVGAVVGAKIVDDNFARSISKRTGAAVGFYADSARVASGAPDEFDKAYLDEITADLKALDTDKDYQDPDKGRSEVRVLREHLGVIYARLPGEAWPLGAGFAVGHLAASVNDLNPFDFLSKAEDPDKAKVPTKVLVPLVLLLIIAGLAFTFVEHERPRNVFHREILRLGKGEIDVLSPSRFRGAFKKLAADLNEGIEKVAAKGGAPRRAADLEQVLGPIPAAPQMSAFSVPGGPGGSPAPVESSSGARALPRPPPASERAAAPRLRSGQSGQMAAVTPPDESTGDLDVRLSAPQPSPGASGGGRPPPAPPKRPPPAPSEKAAQAAAPPEPAQDAAPAADDFDEIADWRHVYEEFLAVKQQCGEETGSLTFEKFKGTLQRNKDALVARHNCTRVKFTVYVKEGKAALKASPVK